MTDEPNHAYCDDCGTMIDRDMAEDSDEWDHTDDGWLCPHCNPDSEVSW